ncbi:CHY zinc finger protein [Microbacterium sp. No. 7]|uniref:CHY zinc finger protein n=1 Tax=Microbacterium sp. No. 7 TaxID=1714373 RepID=UPI0006ECFEED|nr:CHY zinc finger protein [Microbacterium sp. No. 7]ALJ20714.1 hypothetical protein AOA12_12715 [Microbacterium sp. No. 7]
MSGAAEPAGGAEEPVGGAEDRGGGAADRVGGAEPVRVGDVVVHGVGVDAQTRCAHYAGPNDVLALLFRCCDRWYPCHACHAAVATHDAARWPVADGDAHALLCGRCGRTSTIDEYLGSYACARCGGAFNERCALHHDLYFE